MQTTQILRKNINQLGGMLLSMLPKGRSEILIFLFFSAFYLSYSFFLAFNTEIIDMLGLRYDLYLRFDNIHIYHSGCENMEGHPLLYIFSRPFIYLGYLFADLGISKAKTILFVLMCITMISLSVVYIHRYLKQIANLKGYPVYLLTFMYGFFSTNLVLCFTTESFTISAFLLSFTIFYYSSCVKNEENVTFMTNSFFALGLGGVTITNFVKGIIPMLFVKEDKKLILKKIMLLGFIFFAVLLFLEFQYEVFSRISKRVEYFSRETQSDFFSIVDLFFTAPIFFSEIIWSRENMISETYNGMIIVDYLHHWWQYLFSVSLFGLVIWGIIRNWKNKFVLLLLSVFAVDLVIHVLIKYGIAEGTIYGGHWVYLIPLFLGWLFNSVNKSQERWLSVVVSCLFVFLCVNNMNQMHNFIKLAIEKFPVL